MWTDSEAPESYRLAQLKKEKQMKKKSKGKKYRSAKSGLYVETKYAKCHPDTTVGETEKKRKWPSSSCP